MIAGDVLEKRGKVETWWQVGKLGNSLSPTKGKMKVNGVESSSLTKGKVKVNGVVLS